jgi:hypothetical protein
MLGFIVAPLGQKVAGQYPNEINYAYGGRGSYLEPHDPQFNTSGEPGFYYDTPLGGPAIPTDAELAQNYGYTPVQAGWINAKEGFFPGPWRVPGGWNPAGAWGPQPTLSGASVGLSPLGWGAIVVVAGLLAWKVMAGKATGHKRERAIEEANERRQRGYEAARRQASR